MLIVTDKQTGVKSLLSPEYNYRFDPRNGEFLRWGKTFDDDPSVGMLEIFDLEVSTVCEGIGKGPCKHCYKSNTPKGDNMSFETFKHIFDLISGGVTKVNLTMDDGTIRSYLPDEDVLLVDGSTKKAKLLTYADDVL